MSLLLRLIALASLVGGCSDAPTHNWNLRASGGQSATFGGANSNGGNTGIGATTARGGAFADGVEPGAGASAGASAGADDGRCGDVRTSLDRPDDVTGYQVRVSYVLASDSKDEELDLNGALDRSIALTRDWMFQQTHGRVLRFDTCDGKLDIRFLRLERSDAELYDLGAHFHDVLEQTLKDGGFLTPNKLEAIFYGGHVGAHCGDAAWPPDVPGRVAAVYLKGTFNSATTPDCDETMPGSGAQPNYTDFSMLHELFHALGAVPTCAPHQTGNGHTSDNSGDLMYSGDAAWNPYVLDFGRDDYFDHGRPDCLDVARSAFIEPLPAEPKLPRGF